MKIDRWGQFVEVYDIIVDIEKKEFFFIMEYAPENLDEALQRMKEPSPDKRLSPQAAKDLVFQLLLAMDVLHQNNILHRDLKLENVLVMASGKLKICDFGLARTVTFRQRRNSDTVCTAPYRPLEVCLGEESYLTSVDSWSMGVIIAEILMQG
jgi:serine/threonine protein kinase